MNHDERVLDVNGVALFTKTIGTGPPLLVIHGGPGLEHTYFLPHLSAFATRYTLILYDQRGSGSSEGTIDSASITLANFVKDMEGVRQALRLDRIHLLGHSWGATLAILYALQYPENVNALILANPGGVRSTMVRRGAEMQRQRLSTDESTYLDALTKTERFRSRSPEALGEYFRTLFRTTFFHKDLADTLNLQFTPATARNVTQIPKLLFKGMGNFDIRDQLGSVVVPTLIIHGIADAVPFEAAEEIHKRIRNSQLLILDHAGHFPFIDSPDEFFGAVIDFLSHHHPGKNTRDHKTSGGGSWNTPR